MIETGAVRRPTTRTSRLLISAFAFFGLSLGLAAGALYLHTPPAMLPFVLAVGPTIIAIALAWREGDGALGRMRRSLTRRPQRRIWYLVLAVPVAWAAATVLVTVLLGSSTSGLFDNVFPAIFVIPLVVLLPAFAEELAWRGFALPRLLTSMSPLRAALLLAIPWSLIHVPLFLPGQWYGELAIWPMVVSIVSYSVLLTWVFIGTGGSVLMTALFHAGLNGVAPLMGGLDADASWVIRNLLAAVIAAAVVGLGGLRGRTAEGLESPESRPITASELVRT